jgi:hypothetical protein
MAYFDHVSSLTANWNAQLFQDVEGTTTKELKRMVCQGAKHFVSEWTPQLLKPMVQLLSQAKEEGLDNKFCSSLEAVFARRIERVVFKLGSETLSDSTVKELRTMIWLQCHYFRHLEAYYARKFEGGDQSVVGPWVGSKVRILKQIVQVLQTGVFKQPTSSLLANDIENMYDMLRSTALECLQWKWNVKIQATKAMRLSEIKGYMTALLALPFEQSWDKLALTTNECLLEILLIKDFVDSFLVEFYSQMKGSQLRYLFCFLDSLAVRVVRSLQEQEGKPIIATRSLSWLVELTEKKPKCIYPVIEKLQPLIEGTNAVARRQYLSLVITMLHGSIPHCWNPQLLDFILARAKDKDSLIRGKVLQSIVGLTKKENSWHVIGNECFLNMCAIVVARLLYVI